MAVDCLQAVCIVPSSLDSQERPGGQAMAIVVQAPALKWEE